MPKAIIRCTPDWERYLQSALPPGHKIIADKTASITHSEHIVEGPLVPVREDEPLVEVEMLFSMRRDEETEAIVLRGQFIRYAPYELSDPWEIERWASILEFAQRPPMLEDKKPDAAS